MPLVLPQCPLLTEEPFGLLTDRYKTFSKPYSNEIFQTYVRIIVRANAKKRRLYEQFLSQVHILQVRKAAQKAAS